jgi:hypothetical protein
MNVRLLPRFHFTSVPPFPHVQYCTAYAKLYKTSSYPVGFVALHCVVKGHTYINYVSNG